MVSTIFFFIASSVILFQGLNLILEEKNPSGITPQESAQESVPVAYIGSFLISWGGLSIALGVWHSTHAGWNDVVHVVRIINWIVLGCYGLWIIFSGRQVDVSTPPQSHTNDEHH